MVNGFSICFFSLLCVCVSFPLVQFDSINIFDALHQHRNIVIKLADNINGHIYLYVSMLRVSIASRIEYINSSSNNNSSNRHIYCCLEPQKFSFCASIYSSNGYHFIHIDSHRKHTIYVFGPFIRRAQADSSRRCYKSDGEFTALRFFHSIHKKQKRKTRKESEIGRGIGQIKPNTRVCTLYTLRAENDLHSSFMQCKMLVMMKLNRKTEQTDVKM